MKISWSNYNRIHRMAAAAWLYENSGIDCDEVRHNLKELKEAVHAETYLDIHEIT